MKEGYLSQYFESVAAKRLSAVEVNMGVSHQHEFNGSQALKQVFGVSNTNTKNQFDTRFIWIGDENESVTADGKLSWYNSRIDKPRPPEYRLYFPSEVGHVMGMAKLGDLLIIAKRTDGTVMCIIVASGSTIESQMIWLFGVQVQSGKSFISHDFSHGDDKEVDFAVRFILDELGIDIEEPEADFLDSLLDRYKGKLPTSKDFSKLTRDNLPGVDPIGKPDETLMAWMNQEEKLFRRIERFEVEKKLSEGFGGKSESDVEGFLRYSLSIQNRRKSRAGRALENHLQEIFRVHQISYSHLHVTEGKSKPDFIFPSIESYHDGKFPTNLLTMLGVKTTCKDRWRQILTEAARIQNKHLLTLEPGISENQTKEMQLRNVQLVLPAAIHDSYKVEQRPYLMSLTELITYLSAKQKRARI